MVSLARIAGIRITLDPSWFLIFLLVAYSLAAGFLPDRLPDSSTATHWILGALLSIALFGSVLAHELAHAMVARIRNVKVDEIMLFLFGGVAKLRSEPRDAASEFLIAAAGPIMSITLGLTLLSLIDATGERLPAAVNAGLWWLGVINVALAIFNLIPGFPLDGGRILRAILWWRVGDFSQATITAARTGQVFAALLIGIGLVATILTGHLSWLWEIVIGWFLWSAASRSIRLVRLRSAVQGVPVREFLTNRVPAIRADHDVRVGYMQTRAGRQVPEIAVIERDGRLVGVVSSEDLSEAAAATPTQLARDLATPPAEEQIFSPDDDADLVIARLPGLQDQLMLVVRGGILVGTVDAHALTSVLLSEGTSDTESASPPVDT